jgi:hypothetical protein
MQLKLEIEGDIEEILKDERRRMGFATTAGLRYGGETLKGLLRAQIRSAGLGNRLANTIRHDPKPRKGFSYTPAGLVYASAQEIVSAFAYGAVIRAKRGTWLAIPTPEAGRGTNGRVMTPEEWERRAGRKLRFVHNRKRGTAFLVADDLRISKRTGVAKSKGGRRRKDGILSGSQTVPIFLLVRQVSLRKRLDVEGALRQVQAMLPSLILQQWQRSR